MADAEQLFKDVEISDEVKSTILTRVEALENEHKSKLDEAIQTRQAAKSKLSEIETKYAEIQDKFSKGDFDGKSVLEEQLSKLKTANESLLSEKVKLEENLTTIKTQKDLTETATKEMLKNSFSDEKWKTIEKLPISTIAELAKFESKTAGGFDKGTNNNIKHNLGEDFISKDAYKNMTPQERLAVQDKATKSMKYWT